MLESRQRDHVEIRENNATVVGETTRTKIIVQPEGRLATSVERQTTLPNSADLPLLESSTSSGESSRKVGASGGSTSSGESSKKVGASRNIIRIRGNQFVIWITHIMMRIMICACGPCTRRKSTA